MAITVDTQILIWGVRKKCTKGQESQLKQAQDFFSWLTENGTDVVLTAETVGEYLTGSSRAAREMIVLESSFIILPYDGKAAAIAAQIRSDKDFLRTLGKDVTKTRVAIKSDIKIVATAIAHGVETIYSDDTDVHAIGKRCSFEVRPLPPVRLVQKTLEFTPVKSPKAKGKDHSPDP